VCVRSPWSGTASYRGCGYWRRIVVGLDSYDLAHDDTTARADYVREPYGLPARVRFAAAHHKPVSCPEWGMYGAGDDPAYVAAMLTWIGTHDTLYQTITDYCPHGVWQCDANPRASSVYRAALSRH
jgi:hypothetical protein